ncbi:MAG TPA: hypothetical protein GXZ86_04440 [Clostridiales bacterium]|nr:hypothetical protein [Clostridiales bacterium]
MQDQLLIINYNARYSADVAKMLRANGVYCQIVAPNYQLPEDRDNWPLGLVFSGGVDKQMPSIAPELLAPGLPVLALGNAAASLCETLGGNVEESVVQNRVETVDFQPGVITKGLDSDERMLHTVFPLTLPEDAFPIARVNDKIIAFRSGVFFGVGFQLETNDVDGGALLNHFAKDVCGCSGSWSESVFIADAEEMLKNSLQGEEAVCFLTGGLNSGVVTLIGNHALGSSLHVFFVDTGLYRQDEVKSLLKYYQDREGIEITVIDAKHQILEGLRGLKQEHLKREKVIAIIKKVLNEAVKDIQFSAVLRGNLADDFIFNAVSEGLIENNGVRVIFPLKDLFKSEVRYLAKALGMPVEPAEAQSFPITGLSLRIHGEVTEERLATLRRADALFAQVITNAGQHKRLWKYFAAMYPCEEAEANEIIALRAVSLSENRTGGFSLQAARLNYDLLEIYSDALMAACPNVKSVFYDFSSTANSSEVQWL